MLVAPVAELHSDMPARCRETHSPNEDVASMRRKSIEKNSMRTQYALACLRLVCRVRLTSVVGDGVVDGQPGHTVGKNCSATYSKGGLHAFEVDGARPVDLLVAVVLGRMWS
jgi:hypothetical protein